MADNPSREPSDEELDERFVLHGDPEEALKKLLSVRVPIDDLHPLLVRVHRDGTTMPDTEDDLIDSADYHIYNYKDIHALRSMAGDMAEFAIKRTPGR